MTTVTPISVHIENVRSFAGEHEVPIRPLTLLVGENSSGKSTFLAVAACVFGGKPFAHPGFNDPPFKFASFDSIAALKGKSGRRDSFTIGFTVGEEDAPRQSVKATYQAVESKPWLSRLEASSPLVRLVLRFEKDAVEGELVLAASKTEKQRSLELRAWGDFPNSLHETLAPGLPLAPLLAAMAAPKDCDPATLRRVFSLLESLRFPFSSVSASPAHGAQRWLDEQREAPLRNGDHIPHVIAHLFNGASHSPTAVELGKVLKHFGEVSGMFEDVIVKPQGKSASDAFGVQVNVGGAHVSLADAGDGVNQALSVLVQVTLRKENSLMLLQQPETYLHPRAQAELGTFLAEQIATNRGAMLVETHSDRLLDRVRIEVAKGTIKPEQVLILFFDRPKLETDIYPIQLDEVANVLDAPECYRSFFLEEDLRLLRRGKS